MKLLTGVPPSKRDGAGDFLLYLIKIKKVRVLWKPKSLCSIFKEVLWCFTKSDWDLLNIICFTITEYIKYENKLAGNRHKEKICLFHIQSLGCGYINKKLRERRVESIYIVDNFYFCANAYNWRKIDPLSACTVCFDSIKVRESSECMKNMYPCENIVEYANLNNKLRNEFSGKIYVQNNNQEAMAIKYFKKAKVKKVGMISYSAIREAKFGKKQIQDIQELVLLVKRRYNYLVVVHAHKIGAKGLYAVTKIAKKSPSIGFIVPYKLEKEECAENLFSYECSWRSGLKELCETADIVLVPSIWSVPIEGALLKSMRYAKRVVALKEAYEYGEYDFRKIHYIELSRNDIGIQLEKLINKGETNKEMLQELKYKMYDWETKLEELVEEM